MKTVAIIQARLGSIRLPGKVLHQICGQPMISRVVDRVAQCKNIDEIVIATTEEERDDLLVDFCKQQGWNCIRGSEMDVLSRFVVAAEKYDADTIVRVTSDCPLVDPELVDQVVDSLGDDYDCACNFFPQRLYPRGLDAEAITRETLLRLDREARDPRHREHVTLKMYEQPSSFRIASVLNRLDHSYLRWTVDTKEDLELVQTIFTHFSNVDQTEFGYADVMRALSKNWQWCHINREISQKVA